MNGYDWTLVIGFAAMLSPALVLLAMGFAGPLTRLWGWFQRKTERVQHQVKQAFEHSPASQGRVWKAHEETPMRPDGGCPNCFNKTFYEGPSGGMSNERRMREVRHSLECECGRPGMDVPGTE